jgi:hypothetical protein
VDFWDLTKLLWRRWYFALPALVLTAVASVLTLVTVQPNYIATASVQLVPPITAPAQPGMASIEQRNPWVSLGLDALANAALVSLTDGSIVEVLEAGGYSDSFTPTLSSSSPLLKLEVVGISPDQAIATADMLVRRYDQAVKDLQASYNVAPADYITTKRIDNTTIGSLKESDSKVKRALVAVTGAGLLLTIAWTIGLDSLLRRRARKRSGLTTEFTPFDLPPGPAPAASRFDRATEPPVSRLPLPEAIPAIRPFADRPRTGPTAASAPVPVSPAPPATNGGPAVPVDHEPVLPDVTPVEREPAVDPTNSITLIPPDGTVILPLSHKSWRLRDTADGEGRTPR